MQRNDKSSLVVTDTTKKAGQVVKSETTAEVGPPPDNVMDAGDGETMVGFGDGRSIDMGNWEWVRCYLRLELPCLAKPKAIVAGYEYADAWVQVALKEDALATKGQLVDGKAIFPAMAFGPPIPDGVLEGKLAYLTYEAGLSLSMGDKVNRRIDASLRVPFKLTQESLGRAHQYVRDICAGRLQKKLEADG